LTEVFGRWGVTHTAVDATDLSAVERAITPRTVLVMVETPANPTLTVTDIAAVAALAHSAGSALVVDNTWGTPLGQRCVELGADIVMYSTTKYHGGHSDVLGGALVTARIDERWERIRMIQRTSGAVASPFDSWLVHRGLSSMPCRFDLHCRNAQALAEYLAEHPAIEHVHYPGLATHAGHAIAKRQMLRFGGMVAVEVRGDAAHALAVAGRLRLFTRATSLGGPESLIEHRYSMEGPDSVTAQNLLRISVGLEDSADLIEDLEQALSTS
jgi:cystathionine gamma-synthase